MSEPTTHSVTVPSSKEDRKKLKTILAEMTQCMHRADLEKESMKELAADAAKSYEIPKKIITKLARTMYQRTYDTIIQENEDFETLYETLVLGKQTDESN